MVKIELFESECNGCVWTERYIRLLLVVCVSRFSWANKGDRTKNWIVNLTVFNAGGKKTLSALNYCVHFQLTIFNILILWMMGLKAILFPYNTVHCISVPYHVILRK